MPDAPSGDAPSDDASSGDASSDAGPNDATPSHDPGADAAPVAARNRQRVSRIPGSRRARLEPVAGTDTSPDVPVRDEPRRTPGAPRGENDERLWGDVPPHW